MTIGHPDLTPPPGWYDNQMAFESNGANPFAREDYAPRRDPAVIAYVRAGGSMSDYLAEQAAAPERIARSARIAAAFAQIEADLARQFPKVAA